MKELSIEQKAKAYDEALKVLHKYDGANIMFSQSLKEEMFPELKESEDEKTRAEIVRFIQMEVKDEIVGNKWLAWLEKQAEQKPQGKSALEAIKEEKVDNANKVEPKFKVGDWIVWEDKCYKVNYDGCGYELVDQNGLSTSLEYGNIDENAHLWTINDAKPGDIIYAESKFATFDFIVIFSKLENKNVGVYCDVSSDSDDYSDGLDHWEFDNTKGFIEMDRYNFYPVSKEQRDLLFTKMKEAGYEWAKKPKKLK